MKIVFLQNTVDAQGGIVTVNRTLAGAFLAAGAEVHFLSLRHAPVRSQVCYPAAAHTQLVNDRAAAPWDLDIYGVGSLDADSEAQIAADPRVHYLGSTSTPRRCASRTRLAGG